MKNWKIWTAFLTVFASGIIVGVVGVGLVIQHHFDQEKDHAEFRETLKHRFMTHFIEEVQPDTKDIPAIKTAMSETMDELEKIRAETGPRFKAILEKGNKKIKSYLTGEQIKRFDEMIDSFKKRRFNFLRLPPPPPPMP